MQGFIETVFSILEDEDLTLGAKVARDLLQCLMNIVGNSTCQKYLRETAAGMHLIEAPIADLCGLFCIVVAACQDGAASLVSAISLAVTGKQVRRRTKKTKGGILVPAIGHGFTSVNKRNEARNPWRVSLGLLVSSGGCGVVAGQSSRCCGGRS